MGSLSSSSPGIAGIGSISPPLPGMDALSGLAQNLGLSLNLGRNVTAGDDSYINNNGSNGLGSNGLGSNGLKDANSNTDSCDDDDMLYNSGGLLIGSRGSWWQNAKIMLGASQFGTIGFILSLLIPPVLEVFSEACSKTNGVFTRQGWADFQVALTLSWSYLVSSVSHHMRSSPDLLG